MAHFLYPLRPATEPEKAAFAYPKEQGILRPRHDVWGIDIGARLVAKFPMLVGNMMIAERDEFVVVEKSKATGMIMARLIRDNRINIEATIEEIDARFHVAPGQERDVNHDPSKMLLGRDPLGYSAKKAKEGRG
jgi:hypothetical protein